MYPTTIPTGRLLLAFLPVIFVGFNAYSQCGTEPVSGTNTVTGSNTIVNSYYPGTADVSAGSFSITVGSRDTRGSSTAIGAGDLIVIVQMQGTDIDTDNNDSYGDGVNGGNAHGALNNPNMMAGYYEYATVSSFSSSTINLMYGLARSYYRRPFTSSNAIRNYQVIRVPRNYNLIINGGASITSPLWNGTTGGVVVLDAANTLTLNGSLSVSGRGFRGGGGKRFAGAGSGNTNGSGTLTNTDYRWNTPVTTSANTTGGVKGEGVAGTPPYTYSLGNTTTPTSSALEGYINGAMGRGAPANAGGGGTDGVPVGSNNNRFNSGGGGGANAGSGGLGGSGWHGGSGNVNSYRTGGFGGVPYPRNTLQQIIMGGGGGAGTANNSDADNEVNCSGGAGGGIILTRARTYSGNGSVSADGASGPGVTINYSPAQTDAAGGGGAGGTIVMVTTVTGPAGLGSIAASAAGGEGGDVTTYFDHGPGGGGGGGIIYTNGAFASTNVSAGQNGLTRTGTSTGPINNAYGSTAGTNGLVITLTMAPVLTNALGINTICGVLPVAVKNFTASIRGKEVDLSWQAENGLGFSRFEVEYGAGSQSFSRIGSVNYKQDIHQYNHTHASPIAGRNYYRLKKIENDGKYTYSQTLTVNLQEIPAGKLLLYPNPASSSTTLQYQSQAKQWITIQAFDYSGKTVINKKHLAQKGRNSISLPEIALLNTGLYLVVVDDGVNKINEKLVIKRGDQ